MPQGETLENLAKTGATLAIHLSIHRLREVATELAPHYSADCPVAVVFRASWPDEQVITGTLATIEAKLDASINRTALILVGPALVGKTDVRSALYSTDYDRRYRPQSADSPFSSIDQDEPQ